MYIYIYIYVCIYMYIYIHKRIYIYTYINICIYMCTSHTGFKVFVYVCVWVCGCVCVYLPHRIQSFVLNRGSTDQFVVHHHFAERIRKSIAVQFNLV